MQQRWAAPVRARVSDSIRGAARVWGVFAALTLASGFAAPAAAQMEHGAAARSFHVGLGGGVSVPAGDLDQALKSGFNGQGFVSWQPMGMPFGVRAKFGYEHFDMKPVTPGTPAEGTGQILSGLAGLTLGFPIGPIRPYLTAGLGAFHMNADAPSGSPEPKAQTDFGIDGGAGLEVRLGPLSAYVEGRLANVFTDKGLNPSLSMSEGFAAQTIPITFGLVY
jgi:hypothetical protein